MELHEKYLCAKYIEYTNKFRCVDKYKDDQVQLFLQEQALDLMERNLVRTRLFFDENQNLIGFYSLFNDTVKMNKYKRKEVGILLPKEVKEIPAIRLHYIGVDNRFRGRGYGEKIMGSALFNCIKVAKISGCSLITLESTEYTKVFYEKFDFKYIRPEGKYRLMVMNTSKLLDLVQ